MEQRRPRQAPAPPPPTPPTPWENANFTLAFLLQNRQSTFTLFKKVRCLLSSHLRQDKDAKFPTPSFPDDTVNAASYAYIKSLYDAVHQTERLQMKKKAKGNQSTFDPRKPKRLWIYVATE